MVTAGMLMASVLHAMSWMSSMHAQHAAVACPPAHVAVTAAEYPAACRADMPCAVKCTGAERALITTYLPTYDFAPGVPCAGQPDTSCTLCVPTQQVGVRRLRVGKT
jgi:hypothetical protein